MEQQNTNENNSSLQDNANDELSCDEKVEMPNSCEEPTVSKKLLLLDSPLQVLKKRDLVLCIGTNISQLEVEYDSNLAQNEPILLDSSTAESAPTLEFNTDVDIDEFELTSPRKRSSSLKGTRSGQSSPGLPKAVHFADAMGLDLAFIRKIINTDDPPEIPKSALTDLHLSPSYSVEEELTSFSVSSRYLVRKFSLPNTAPDFLSHLLERKVMLESCDVDDAEMLVTGIVRVANIDYNKSVMIRYSINNWLTQEELNAFYICNSCDGPTDKFSFSISLPEFFEAGMTMQFALMYTAGGMTFWDNNFGVNYIIECKEKSISSDV